MKLLTPIVLCLAAAPLLAYDTDLVYPWITHNANFQTQIIINNLNPEAATIQLTAARAAGSEPGDATLEPLEIGPLESMVVNAGDLFPELGEGSGFMVRLTSAMDHISGAFVVTAGSSPAQANVSPAAEAGTPLLYNYLSIQPGGIAAPMVINMGDVETEVTFHLYQNGVKPVDPVTRVVPAGRPHAELASSLFPGVEGDFYVVAEADAPLLGVAFIFNAAGEPSMANAVPIGAVPNPEDIVTQAPVTVSTPYVLPGTVRINNGLVVGSDGTVFGTDFFGTGGGNGTKVYKIAPDGMVETFATVSQPTGLALDQSGNLYVAGFRQGTIHRISPDGTKITFASSLFQPAGLVFDADGNLLVASFNDGSITKVDPSGATQTFINPGRLVGLVGLTRDDMGNIYASGFENGAIYKITGDGSVSRLTTVPAAPLGYLTYTNDALYATATEENRIYKITLDGEVSVFAGMRSAGSLDGNVDSALFTKPDGIAAHPAGGILFVSENDTNQLRMITF